MFRRNGSGADGSPKQRPANVLQRSAAAVGLMFVYSPHLTLVFLVTAPLYALLMFFSRRWLRPLFQDLEESFARYHSYQIDAIKGMSVLDLAERQFIRQVVGNAEIVGRVGRIIRIYRRHREGLDVVRGAGTVIRTRYVADAAGGIERCDEQGNAGKHPLVKSRYPGIPLLSRLFIGPRERIDFINAPVRRIGAERRPIERRAPKTTRSRLRRRSAIRWWCARHMCLAAARWKSFTSSATSSATCGKR